MAGFCHHLLWLQKAHFFVSLYMIYLLGSVKLTGTDTHKGNSVTMSLVHICLDLKHKGRKIVRHRINLFLICNTRKRRGCHGQEVLQKSLHTKVCQRRSKKYRSQLTFTYQLLIKICTCSVKKLYFFHQLFLLIRIYDFIKTGVINVDLLNDSLFCSLLCIGKGQHLMGVSVINAAEFLSGTNGPVNRAGCNSQFLFDLIQKIKGIVCISVHFVDKCKNRNMAHYTDLEQLSCLRLHTLASVNDHDSGICCHQGTVGILREILMSWCIQNIDTVTVIMELKHRGGYGNTSLLLDFHPVRYCMAGSCLSLYTSCQIDGASIKKEFFCQCCLTGIRVGNNGKGSSFFYLFRILGHV